MALHPLIEKFLAFQRSATSRRVYGSDLADWARFLEGRNRSLTEPAEEEALQWRETLEARSLAASTVSRKLSVARRLYDFIAERDLLCGQANPFARIPLPRVDAQEGRTPTPSKEEVERLLRSMDGRTPRGLRDRLIGLLLFNQGLRVSEVARLRKANLELERGTAAVTFVAKGGFRHRVFLAPATRILLIRHLRTTVGEGDHLFFALPGGRPSTRFPQKHLSPRTIHSNLKQYARAAGIDPKKVRPHSGRVFFITEAYLQTHDIELVSRAVGHRSVATTRRYLRLPEDVAKRASWSVRLRI